MIRKIIKQGHNTLTVTLPSEWVKRFNLNPGAEVNLIERENGLFLTSEKINKPTEIQVDITGLSIPLIWKYITTAYRAGYDKIKVKFPSDAIFNSPYTYFAHYIRDYHFGGDEKLTAREFMNEISDRFVGFEVIDHGKEFCILAEIGQPSRKEFDSSLRRIFLLLLDISEGIIEDLKNNKNNYIKKVHNDDMQIDKFHDFCARVLNKTGVEEPSKSYLIFTLIYLLELVGDEFKQLAVQLEARGFKKTDSARIISSLNSINEQLKIFYELYYKYDKEQIKKLFKLNSEFSNGNGKSYKTDVEVTVDAINRYIYALSELLIAKQISNEGNV